MAALLRMEGQPPELILLEIQSLLVMEDGSSLAGQHLGVLEANGKQVTLTNGPRTLYGKLQDLPKPLVLMERTGQEEDFGGDSSRKSVVFKAQGMVRRKAVFNQRPQLKV
mmetsp:Transcript_11559/g.17405  ORF Transcript_11559/g.17405 Transcript_11559/m.17405 type:complete len:110 (-) Transcript_11559:152-481(-)|eukprot:CAMPEP_0194765010 /NCGR_PEP_ID=MMETSP0323_2-20130528/24403_1 /TAXON_ID=2866 ORGANISM="Crypthecodinium cohnii, Strain Seligo" /NCGR_SAMPLE_ID=MMETSP0323_2 /ASSEMBLY_ACC=CAM_ASM_000346 /LENGTH=109 /DNA_ID=CAMNT_0039693445 /DNA_START=143 /DNA_END=472 /DNA_ORIENTATION=+